MNKPRPRLPLLEDIVSADGASFPLRALRGPSPDSAVVLLLPAMGAPARFYTPFVRALHAAGLTVVMTDLRGQGESIPRAARSVHFGYHHMLHYDLDAIVTAVRRHFPAAPLVLLGHCLGGQLALLYAAHRRPPVSGIVLIASGSSWFRCWAGWAAVRKLMFNRWVALVSVVLRYWPGDRLKFAGPQSMGTMVDWAREARYGRYRIGGSAVDYERALRGLTVPVLGVDVDDDQLTPRASVDHLCGKLTAATVTRMRHSREDVGGQQLDHFRWVRYHYTLGDKVRGWIDSVVSSTPVDAVSRHSGTAVLGAEMIGYE